MRTVLSVLLLLLLGAVVGEAVGLGDLEMAEDFLRRAHVRALHGVGCGSEERWAGAGVMLCKQRG